jgi:hypothetical protein
MSISKLIYEKDLVSAEQEINEELRFLIDDAIGEMVGVDEIDVIDEAGRRIVIKVTSKGKRRKKVMCGPGKKFDGTKCVVQSAKEKLARKKGLRIAQRTKKAKGAGAKKIANRLRMKALKKRRGQGLK